MNAVLWPFSALVCLSQYSWGGRLPWDNAGSEKECDWQLGTAVTLCLTGFFLCACGPWEAGKATLLLGSSGQPCTVPVPGRRIPALDQSVAVLEVRIEVSAQAQASLVACPEKRRRLLLLQACMQVKITPKFTFILTLNSFRARIALKLL